MTCEHQPTGPDDLLLLVLLVLLVLLAYTSTLPELPTRTVPSLCRNTRAQTGPILPCLLPTPSHLDK